MAFKLRNVLLSVTTSFAIPVSAIAQTTPTDAVPPGWVRVEMKQCPPNSMQDMVSVDRQCVPSPTRQCPGKIVVPVGSECPDSKIAPVQPKNVAKRPLPKGKPGTWVPQSAYPREALRDMVEGTVGFTLNVGPDGKPTQCRVTHSSGNDLLDWAACENLMRRASFNPATDTKGKPVASTYSNRVRWVIPESTFPVTNGQPNPMPPPSQDPMAPFLKLIEDNPTAVFDMEIIAIVDSDWSVLSCEATGGVTADGTFTPLTDEIKAEMCKDPPSIFEKKDNQLKGKTRLVTKMSAEKQTLPD